MQTEKTICDVCGKELIGWGKVDLEKNKIVHLKQQHGITSNPLTVEQVIEKTAPKPEPILIKEIVTEQNTAKVIDEVLKTKTKPRSFKKVKKDE